MGAVSWVQGMPGRASPAQISSTGSPSTYTQSAPPPMRPTYIDANLRTTRSNSGWAQPCTPSGSSVRTGTGAIAGAVSTRRCGCDICNL
ncbi:Uncharacterised protein [Mycobacteroides abscessus subsp. abscessus]|nr:Uncharacterised protein [Mycobacteroides abscessus subsp. abscessus]